MKYPKPALSFDAQADLLLKRGLIADRNELIKKLEAVSYYRLSAYWYTFRVIGDPDDKLKPGTTLDTVWRRYTFDRQLRLLVIDAIERVEVAIRSQTVTQHALKYGPFGYLDRNNLPGMSPDVHRKFLEKIRDESTRSREDFVSHYFKKYSSETNLPIWMACELLTFGGVLTLFTHVEQSIKQAVAAQYGVPDVVLESWLISLNFIRNLCAHHARLWNRGLTNKKPMIPRPNKRPEWHSPVPITDDRLFGILTILCFLLKSVAPKSRWKERFKKLLIDYKDIPLRFMGFPDDWEKSPLW